MDVFVDDCPDHEIRHEVPITTRQAREIHLLSHYNPLVKPEDSSKFQPSTTRYLRKTTRASPVGRALMAKKKSKGAAPPDPVPARESPLDTHCDCNCVCHPFADPTMPTAILADLCRRRGWDEPVYSMTESPAGLLAELSVQTTLPTGETIILGYEAPATLKALFVDESDATAKNHIALFTLFSVDPALHQGSKGELGRGWRGKWRREFESARNLYRREGRDWMFNVDPFISYREHGAGTGSV
ncbi:hypothetical protein BJY01DRAFT_245656 [Aspergillus pseudoustus]|uniref:ATP-dependent RNA helicase DHX29 DSRM-like domain-containing protein n=1 Tax=Aspergillus pseudoustus TaxID=1810923 RepID=A0ABR4KD26_9EURO